MYVMDVCPDWDVLEKVSFHIYIHYLDWISAENSDTTKDSYLYTFSFLILLAL